ncbi:MAG: hypothetical protein KF880_02185 [Ferruginibacter sp.]|nr:hypothetical protein [Ferruginibacter sp.]
MTIAVHIPGTPPEHSFYFWCFSEMASLYPDHHFIFITDHPFTTSPELPANVTPHHCPPIIKNTLIRYYWYQVKLPAILERYQVDGMFTPGLFCSLATRVPQVMLLNHAPSRKESQGNVWLKRYIRKASAIACTTSGIENKVQAMFPVTSGKCRVTGKGIHPLFVPHSEVVLDALRKHSTNGNAYLIFEINEKNTLAFRTVLKAFTIFKKWQRSSIELVCLLRTASNQPPISDFSSYKLRQQVHCVHKPDPAATAAWYAGCYAWLDVDTASRLEEQALCAMQTLVPVLSASTYPLIPEDSYLKTNLTEQGVAENMMRIYKDEVLRNQLIHSATRTLQSYNRQNMYEALFKLASGINR